MTLRWSKERKVCLSQSRKPSDGEYRDIAHPINSATRERIQKLILDKYQEVMAEEAENEVLMEAAE